MFHFQIVTENAKEAEKFMEATSAVDIHVEEWSYQNVQTLVDIEETYGFGTTYCRPKHLNRLADSLGVALIYIESEAYQEQQFQILLQRSKIGKNMS